MLVLLIRDIKEAFPVIHILVLVCFYKLYWYMWLGSNIKNKINKKGKKDSSPLIIYLDGGD
ncbi:hypothetical protein HanIR_Chr17g0879851 [Helianthus annuus]|nr:hypothetical protein HanIR_Chr17g0879851 [Helianthus annuus]